MNIKLLQSLYSGFEITEPVGNNVFSYTQRRNKSIWVPPLIQGTLSDLTLGEKVVFSEIEDGIEKNRPGLESFLYFPYQGREVFIFDNHNHAFFFWLAGYLQGRITPGLSLVHIDQHTDMREPQKWPSFSLNKTMDLKEVFDYANYLLNVGNFIQPALRLGLFSNVQIIDSTSSFEKPIPDEFVLDIDLDIFSENMAYINTDLKINKIKRIIEKARFITIATSPYFINQTKAISTTQKLF